MRWSKLRSTIEDGFAPSVRKRVRLEATRYRKSHDHEGRWALVIDDKQVGGMGCIVADVEQYRLTHLIKQTEVDITGIMGAQLKSMDIQRAHAHHTLPMFMHEMFNYLSTSIEDALASDDALIRAIAYLDQRLGKRRLRRLADSQPLTEIEQACLALRLESESIPFKWSVNEYRQVRLPSSPMWDFEHYLKQLDEMIPYDANQ